MFARILGRIEEVLAGTRVPNILEFQRVFGAPPGSDQTMDVPQLIREAKQKLTDPTLLDPGEAEYLEQVVQVGSCFISDL